MTGSAERDKAQQEFALHDQIEKRQAADVERERHDIKQFVVVPGLQTNPAIAQ